MPVNRSLQSDPLRNFKFLVTFSSGPSPSQQLAKAGFMSVSGVALNTEVVAYREGGDNTTMRKMPGQTDFSAITLARGVITGGNGATPSAAWDWVKTIFSTVQGGGSGQDFRATMDVFVLPHPDPGATILNGAANIGKAKWHSTFLNVWPSTVQYTDLDAGANSLLVEQLVVQHEGYDLAFSA